MTAPDQKRAAFEARWKTLGYDDALPAHQAPEFRPLHAIGQQMDSAMHTPLGETAAIELLRPVGQLPRAPALPSISLDERSSTATDGVHATPSAAADLQILRRLGSGGMGTVDLAHQRSLNRDVAVKRLHAEPAAANAQYAQALLREAALMGRLEHPVIVPVHALGVDQNGSPVLVMKRVEGVSWSTLIEQPAHALMHKLCGELKQPLDIHLEILQQICNALSFAHANGVIHRDVKPDNVMVGAYGEVYLLDWGIALDRASLTDQERNTKQMVGTPRFMAPELFDGPVDSHDERTDVYLLGATLHNVLTGQPRHQGDTLHALLLSSCFSTPYAYAPEVDRELASLCNAATSASAIARPASVEVFSRKIAEYLQHRGSTALARSAEALLDRVRACSAEMRATTEARRWLSEAHFAFVQALKLWSENGAAREGLQSCLEQMIERELELGHPEAVRALLQELPQSNPAMNEALQRLDAKVASERAETENARKNAREMDRSLSAGARAALAGLGLLLLVGTSLIQQRPAGIDGLPSNLQLLETDLMMLFAFGAAVVVGRKRLLGNRISRQLSFTLGLLLAGGAFVNVLGLLLGAPVLLCAVFKFAVGGFVLLVGALAVDRPLVLPAGFVLSSALVMARWPQSAAVVGSLTSLIVVLLFLWIPLRKQQET
jgi:serine/threonine-protein kinase